MKHTIYALCEPDGAIRYVGVTCNALARRLGNHIRAARIEKQQHVCYWIRSLQREGLQPTIRPLEVVDDASRADRERFWISYYRSMGCRLTNSTDGGEGLLNPSLETREKIGAAHRGRVLSAEVRQRMSKAQRGLSKPRKQPAKPKPPPRGPACGENASGAKLTWAQVRSLRAEDPKQTHHSLALKYGIKPCQVVKILRGTDWIDENYTPCAPRASPTGERHGRAKLTWERVRALRAEPRPQPLGVLAAKYEIGKPSISMILRGIQWKEPLS